LASRQSSVQINIVGVSGNLFHVPSALDGGSSSKIEGHLSGGHGGLADVGHGQGVLLVGGTISNPGVASERNGGSNGASGRGGEGEVTSPEKEGLIRARLHGDEVVIFIGLEVTVGGLVVGGVTTDGVAHDDGVMHNISLRDIHFVWASVSRKLGKSITARSSAVKDNTIHNTHVSEKSSGVSRGIHDVSDPVR